LKFFFFIFYIFFFSKTAKFIERTQFQAQEVNKLQPTLKKEEKIEPIEKRANQARPLIG
jgi:hypothetical protein